MTKPEDFDFFSLNYSERSYSVLVKNIRSGGKNKTFFLDKISPDLIQKHTHLFSRVRDMGRCGYDYRITIMEDGNVIREALACFQCNRFVYDSKVFAIDRIAFYNFMLWNKFKRLNTKNFSFATAEEGRTFWLRKDIQEGLFLEAMNIPDWIDFDGSFIFSKKYDNAELDRTNELDREKSGEELLTKELELIGEALNPKLSVIVITHSDLENSTHFTFYVKSTKGLYGLLEGGQGSWEPIKNFDLNLLYE